MPAKFTGKGLCATKPPNLGNTPYTTVTVHWFSDTPGTFNALLLNDVNEWIVHSEEANGLYDWTKRDGDGGWFIDYHFTDENTAFLLKLKFATGF